jgi:E3 ubiquitin-protein ligase SHPRH
VEVLSLILANPAPISHTSSVQLDSRSQGVPADESDPSLELAAAETTKSVEISDPTIGMCICGTMISIMDKEPFVICEMCSEPMHACCAHTETENSNDWKRLQYRHCSTVVETRQCPEAFCPCCVASKRNNSTSLISSKATLIVTPPAILNQWQREIQRHTLVETITSTSRGTSEEKVYRPLKVLVYPGVRDLCKQGKMKSKETMLLHPRHLAEADIVLMTFESLMADLSHSDDNPFLRSQDDLTTRSLRRRKVYRVIPSPLQSIHWWRICLDEAQRVETPTLGSAKMALKLSTNFRWAVSGTPAAKGRLDDLFGLLVFLRSRPFSNKHWLHKCFNSSVPYTNEMISHLLKQVLWRSTKASPIVAQQMGVPEQVEKVVLLSFSSIERHFYERQLEETLRAATSLPDKRKSRNAIELVSTQLHKLRAACCHPQVGTGGLARITKGSKKRKFPVTNSQGDSDFSSTGIMTMDQIL